MAIGVATVMLGTALSLTCCITCLVVGLPRLCRFLDCGTGTYRSV